MNLDVIFSLEEILHTNLAHVGTYQMVNDAGRMDGYMVFLERTWTWACSTQPNDNDLDPFTKLYWLV